MFGIAHRGTTWVHARVHGHGSFMHCLLGRGLRGRRLAGSLDHLLVSSAHHMHLRSWLGWVIGWMRKTELDTGSEPGSSKMLRHSCAHATHATTYARRSPRPCVICMPLPHPVDHRIRYAPCAAPASQRDLPHTRPRDALHTHVHAAHENRGRRCAVRSLDADALTSSPCAVPSE